jgi:hypothetical protein
MVLLLRSLAVALLAGVSAEEAADQARSTLLLYKRLSQADGHSVNTPFNVTLTVYNRGESASACTVQFLCTSASLRATRH